MPQPVMKASSSTSAGPAAAVSGAISSRYTRPEQVIATASAIPVQRSQRGSAVIVAAAAPRTASASILTPSSRSTEVKSRCAGPGAEVAVRASPRPNCSAEMTAAVRPATSTNRAAAVAPERRAVRARATAMTAMPAAGRPSVRANCAATAGPCPDSAATISAPLAPKPGEGAGTASPAIQDSE